MAGAFYKRERNPKEESFVSALFFCFTVTDQKETRAKAAPVVQPPKNMSVVWPTIILQYKVRFTYAHSLSHTHTQTSPLELTAALRFFRAVLRENNP